MNLRAVADGDLSTLGQRLLSLEGCLCDALDGNRFNGCQHPRGIS